MSFTQKINPRLEKPTLTQNYLQTAASLAWTKLVGQFQRSHFTQPEISSLEVLKHSSHESYEQTMLNSHFTDRVDPSLYYAVFFTPYN
jgi:hypothetical protein